MNLFPFDKGDALVFCSNKYHAMGEIWSGRKSVLIFEIADALSLDHYVGHQLASLPWLLAANPSNESPRVSFTTKHYPPRSDGRFRSIRTAWPGFSVIVSGEGCLTRPSCHKSDSSKEELPYYGTATLLRMLLPVLQKSSHAPKEDWITLYQRTEAAQGCEDKTLRLRPLSKVIVVTFSTTELHEWVMHLANEQGAGVVRQVAEALIVRAFGEGAVPTEDLSDLETP